MPRWKSEEFYPVCAGYPAERRRPGCGESQGPNGADMDHYRERSRGSDPRA